MKAIILAAGKGSRLYPHTYHTPKPLLMVGGNEIINYVISNVQKCEDITDIYIAVRSSEHIGKSMGEYFSNFKKDFPDEYNELYKANIHLVDVKGWETGGDTKLVGYEANIEPDEDFVLCFGDNITEIDVNEMVKYHKSKNVLATMALFPVPEEDISRMGIARYEEETGLIKQFIEKPKLEDAPSDLANAGYYVMKGCILNTIPFGKVKTEEKIIPELAKSNKLAGYLFDPPYWLDVGTRESLLLADKMILDRKGIIPPVPRDEKNNGDKNE